MHTYSLGVAAFRPGVAEYRSISDTVNFHCEALGSTWRFARIEALVKQ